MENSSANLPSSQIECFSITTDLVGYLLPPFLIPKDDGSGANVAIYTIEALVGPRDNVRSRFYEVTVEKPDLLKLFQGYSQELEGNRRVLIAAQVLNPWVKPTIRKTGPRQGEPSYFQKGEQLALVRWMEVDGKLEFHMESAPAAQAVSSPKIHQPRSNGARRNGGSASYARAS